jgi:hypothetical protein
MASDTDLTYSQLGVINNTSDGSWAQDNTLFLKVFSGEVLTAFEETNVMKDRHRVRVISHGKSAQFPVSWKASARYHTPGTAILGNNQTERNERTINIDDLLIADEVIYDLDEMKNHYDVRSEISRQLGAALARTYDKNTMQVVALAARASGNTTSSPGGSEVTNASCKTDAEVLASCIFSSGQALDENDVPADGRHCLVKPAQYNMLAQSTKVINKDWDGSGSYSRGTVHMIDSIPLVKTNNLPTTDLSGTVVTGEHNTYYSNFSNIGALVFHESAIGTVQLMGLVTQMTSSDFKVVYQGTLLVAKYALGHGILRPECAVEITNTATSGL